MTEDEAKTKWCHRCPRLQRASNNPRRTSKAKSLCLGSGCMAWRWAEGSYLDAKRGFMVHDLGKAGVGHASGYCGLVGKP